MTKRALQASHVLDRRRLLRGLGGVTIGLPMLSVFMPRRGQAAARKIYSAFILQANGVMQAAGKEPEMFWPRVEGTLSKETMAGGDADRATSELKDWAHKLLMVQGIKFNFPSNGCGHSGGGSQVLTAAKVSAAPRGNRSFAMGESVDNRIARELTPGREPFAVYAGKKGGYIDDNLSFRGPLQVRAGDNNPWSAYSRMVRLGGPAANPDRAMKLVARRRSVNDLVRAQFNELKGRAGLTGQDKQRLDLHFSSIRDLELTMLDQLPAEQVAALQAIDGKHRNTINMEAVVRMQMDLIALVLASDYARTATLQIGDGNDSTEYTIDGVKLPSFHMISHRVYGNGGDGAPIENAFELHHKIDRLHAKFFKYLVEKVASYIMPSGGTLLDDSFLVWTNSLANGPPHGYDGVPFIVAGSGGGYLKQGQYVNVRRENGGRSVTNNRLLNTLLNAAGVRKAVGDDVVVADQRDGPRLVGALVDNFGDPSLPKGQITSLLA